VHLVGVVVVGHDAAPFDGNLIAVGLEPCVSDLGSGSSTRRGQTVRGGADLGAGRSRCREQSRHDAEGCR
jgi:hypothetical protein